MVDSNFKVGLKTVWEIDLNCFLDFFPYQRGTFTNKQSHSNEPIARGLFKAILEPQTYLTMTYFHFQTGFRSNNPRKNIKKIIFFLKSAKKQLESQDNLKRINLNKGYQVSMQKSFYK